MLDISIENADKWIKIPGNLEKLEGLHLFATEKIDGVKISIIRNDKPFSENPEDNWIIAYKNKIIYHNEYDLIDDTLIQSESIGNFQFKFVWNHIKSIHKDTLNFKTSQEFFCEFTVRKPTITRNYETLWKLYLIGFAEINYDISQPGRIYTNPIKTSFSDLNNVAIWLKINLPPELFNDIYQGKTIEDWNIFSNKLLSIPSSSGGVSEGAVITGNNLCIKLLQPDQHSKEVRNTKKSQWISDNEDMYFLNLKKYVNNFIPKKIKSLELELSESYARLIDPIIPHKKKTKLQILEDTYYIIRYLLEKRIDKNISALIIGRFQPPTSAHIKMIESAFKTNDKIAICIVNDKRSERNPLDFRLQEKMLKEIFPDATIFKSKTANVFRAIELSKLHISKVFCGTDRFDDYNKQLKNNPEIKIVKINRNKSKISATILRSAIVNNQSVEGLLDIRLNQFLPEIKKQII